ncbi:1-deoxy-D-xylulose-5-phosphate reductoisomerase [bacterium]|nr:MAG: 1-deoxy-D-xylulose-5-phosphate reductoisomerase [bacterium]
MNHQRICILGSTGSIGTQTLEIIRRNPEKFSVISLSAYRNWELLAQQIEEFQPEKALIRDAQAFIKLKERLGSTKTEVICGFEHCVDLVVDDHVDVVLNALVGASGFIPTYKAIQHGKKVALANKESLVTGGEIITQLLDEVNGLLLPVDSEHSALFQCLQGEPTDSVEKLILTASGGPFRDFPLDKFASITVEQALKHPNWDMGAKITIDSSTMMNKGLELIEAQWLFRISPEKLDAVIHPQSMIHSMVTFVDGSTKAQLGPPDMMVPIQYALSHPDRWESEFPRVDWTKAQQWEFRPVDYNRYPCLQLAKASMLEGGYAPTVLNASNEIAVERFLNKEIPYIHIAKIVEKSLEKVQSSEKMSVDRILAIDEESRKIARSIQL